MPVIPATEKVRVRGLGVSGQPGQFNKKRKKPKGDDYFIYYPKPRNLAKSQIPSK
jgi:hypothetical protein